MALLRDQMKQALATKNRQNRQAPGYRQMEAGTPPQQRGLAPRMPEQTNADPKEQAAYETVVLSGMKFLYDEATHESVMDLLGAGETSQAMATTCSTIMIELDERNGGKIPETVILPAAMELMDAITELVEIAKIVPQVTPDMAENATHILVQQLGQYYGVDPEEMKAFIQQTVPAKQLVPAAREASINPSQWRPYKEEGAAPGGAPPAKPEEEEEVS